MYESLSQSIETFMEKQSENELETVLQFLEELNNISQRDLDRLLKSNE